MVIIPSDAKPKNKDPCTFVEHTAKGNQVRKPFSVSNEELKSDKERSGELRQYAETSDLYMM